MSEPAETRLSRYFFVFHFAFSICAILMSLAHHPSQVWIVLALSLNLGLILAHLKIRPFLSLLFAVVMGLPALFPVTFESYLDLSRYYAYMPRLLNEGGWSKLDVVLPFYSLFPMGAAVNNAWLFQAGGEWVAQLFWGVNFGVAVAMLAHEILNKWDKASISKPRYFFIIISLLIAFFPFRLDQSPLAFRYQEIFWQLLGVIALLKYKNSNNFSWLFFSICSFAFAAASNYSSIIVWVALIPVYFLTWKDRNSRIEAKVIATALISAAIAGFWYLLSWYRTGSPVSFTILRPEWISESFCSKDFSNMRAAYSLSDYGSDAGGFTNTYSFIRLIVFDFFTLGVSMMVAILSRERATILLILPILFFLVVAQFALFKGKVHVFEYYRYLTPIVPLVYLTITLSIRKQKLKKWMWITVGLAFVQWAFIQKVGLDRPKIQHLFHPKSQYVHAVGFEAAQRLGNWLNERTNEDDGVITLLGDFSRYFHGTTYQLQTSRLGDALQANSSVSNVLDGTRIRYLVLHNGYAGNFSTDRGGQLHNLLFNVFDQKWLKHWRMVYQDETFDRAYFVYEWRPDGDGIPDRFLIGAARIRELIKVIGFGSWSKYLEYWKQSPGPQIIKHQVNAKVQLNLDQRSWRWESSSPVRGFVYLTQKAPRMWDAVLFDKDQFEGVIFPEKMGLAGIEMNSIIFYSSSSGSN